MLDDARESLVMAMLYRQFYDINTEDPAEIDKALADLKALIPICNPKINITEYQTLATRRELAAPVLVGRSARRLMSTICRRATTARTLRFWSPPKGKGPIQNDCWAVSCDHEEAGAGPSVAELPARQGCGLQQFHRASPAISRRRVSITADSLIAKKVVPENSADRDLRAR